MKKIANETELMTPFTVDELRTFLDTAFPYFEEKWTEGEDNERRWLGKNFTKKQEQQIRNQGRQPYSFGQARTKANRIIGIQEEQRTQFNISASQDPDDEIKAELAKLQTHGVELRSEFPFLESYIFTCGTSIKHGVTKMCLDYTNVFPRVAVSEVDWRNFMWDRNMTAYSLNARNNGALWVCEIDTEYRKLIEQRYGYKSKLISQLTEGSFSTFEGRKKINYYVRESNSDHNYDVISLFNFYIKTPRKCWYVIFPDTAKLNGNTSVIESKHRTKKDAEERLRELQIPYLLQGLPAEGDIEDRDELGYDRYVFTYDKILEYEETDLEMFPYDLFRSIHLGDDYCSFMDLLKDVQKWYDRFIMQIDYALGKDNKVSKQLNVNKLAEGETPTTALQKIEDGKTILVNSSEEVLRAIEMKGVNPQWLQMLDLILMVFEDLAMGQQFNAKSNATDSGTKVQQLIAQGGLGVKPFFDNLRRWKIGVGKNILSWMKKYETAQDVIRVQGGSLTPEMIELLTQNNIYVPSKFDKDAGYVTINKEGSELSYLADANFELEVTEEALSDGQRNGQLAIALENEKADPSLLQMPSWIEYRLSLMPIPQNLKHKIIAEKKQIIENMAQQAKEKNDLERRKVDIQAAQTINSAPAGTFADA